MPTATVISTFPPGYFLENIASTQEGGLLVSCANRQEVYYIHPTDDQLAAPMLIHKFESDQWAMGIAEAPQNPNLFYMVSSDMLAQGSRASYLYMLDLAYPAAGCLLRRILQFPSEAKGLNGLCCLSAHVLLVADSFASCIWRVDLEWNDSPIPTATASKWLSHPTMDGKLVLPDFQPGTNGLKYSPVTQRVYYTSTQQHLFCQVRVNQQTLAPEGDVDIVHRGMPADDLILDDRSETESVAYVTTHRDNTIVKVPLDGPTMPRTLTATEVMTEGSEQNANLLGPTAGTWARSMKGTRAFFTFDGGLKHPATDGVVRGGRVVRLDF